MWIYEFGPREACRTTQLRGDQLKTAEGDHSNGCPLSIDKVTNGIVVASPSDLDMEHANGIKNPSIQVSKIREEENLNQPPQVLRHRLAVFKSRLYTLRL